MSQVERKEEAEKKEIDPLMLLSHAWDVEAGNEVDALFKAMEKSTMVPEYVWRGIVSVVPAESGIYMVINKRAGSLIVARVVRAQRAGRYTVTFYPSSYRVVKKVGGRTS